MQVSVLDARNRLSRLIKAAAAGEEVVIANRGLPVAKLVAVDSAEGRKGVPELVDWLRESPTPGRGTSEIDRQLATERKSWR